MRIQEVMGKTGLSRRTIHYYIDQKLIIPPVNEGNGYHDFTEEDVQKLFIIRKLREAGLSLADIRAILRKPRTMPFYLHKQMNELQTQMLTIQKTISEMDRLKEVNKRTVENFIKAGAFDCFGVTRKQLMFVYANVLDDVAREKKDSLSGQMSLFDFVDETTKRSYETVYPDVGEYEKSDLSKKRCSASTSAVIRSRSRRSAGGRTFPR